MRLEAKVGTLKIVFENQKDLETKLIQAKETHEKQMAQLQAEWKKVEKPFKEKMKAVRKNISDIQKALTDLSGATAAQAVAPAETQPEPVAQTA